MFRSALHALINLTAPLDRAITGLQPALLLAIRVYIARVFFLSGLTKIRDWDTTLLLFTEEYKVPVLPPALAALAGTAGELIFPVLLVLGLGWRLPALALFVVNLVAVISYPGLAEAAVKEHFYWGALIAVLVILGHGRWSMDAWLNRNLRASTAQA
jgi:putative oxidoreductase